jgi:hypothetical protein
MSMYMASSRAILDRLTMLQWLMLMLILMDRQEFQYFLLPHVLTLRR